MDSLSQDLTSGRFDQVDPGMTRLRWLAAALLALVFVAWLIVGCTTVRVEHLTAMSGSKVTIRGDKTIVVTTDASIPAGALGL
jgi:hypothetical protein